MPTKAELAYYRAQRRLVDSPWQAMPYARSANRASARPRRRAVGNTAYSTVGRTPMRAPYYNRSTGRRVAYRTARRAIPRSYARMAGRSGQALMAGRYAARAMESPCVTKWAKSLQDPFDGPQEACNPFTLPLYSERLRTRIHGGTAIATNTANGTGNQIVLAAGFSPASDIPLLAASDATAWTDASTLSTICSGSTMPVSPFSVSQFTNLDNSWAPVSLGMRVMYVGPADSFGGEIIYYETANHSNALDGGTTLGDVKGSANCRRQVIKPGWNTIVWSGPRRTSEMTYSNDLDPVYSRPWCLVMVVVGAAATSAAMNFAVEVFCNCEVSGDDARSGQFSEQDAHGAARRMTANLKANSGAPSIGSGQKGVSNDAMFGKTYSGPERAELDNFVPQSLTGTVYEYV